MGKETSRTKNVGSDDKPAKGPRKRFFRSRAHVNPMSQQHWDVPRFPSEYDWVPHFPQILGTDPDAHDGLLNGGDSKNDDNDNDNDNDNDKKQKRVTVVDIGCGFGGLLTRIAPLLPEELILGMEIRGKVSAYVKERIGWFRDCYDRRQKGEDEEASAGDDEGVLTNPGDKPMADPTFHYRNVSIIHTNAMKYLPNYFEKGQLERMFFLFPDPHFKRQKHRLRIIHDIRLAEYAYLMKVGGILYTCTDVLDLHNWMVAHLDAHPLFERIPDKELEGDPFVDAIMYSTEEAYKVQRNKGNKYPAVYRRVAGPADE